MDDDDFRMESKQGVAWMITFTDLVSLMLTFFVLLFSMSNIKVDRWNDVIDALSQSLNPSSTKAEASATSSFNIETLFRKRAINLDYLASVLTDATSKDELLMNSRLLRMEDRLVIALPGDLLFDPGKAVLNDGAKKALFNLGGVLRNVGNRVGINGHTDPSPPSGTAYTSNWELSMGRATAVANTLKRSGFIEEITSFGYADSQYTQQPHNDAEKRQALGRRVDIVVFPTVGEF